MQIRLRDLRRIIREELDWVHRSLPKEKTAPEPDDHSESFGSRDVEDHPKGLKRYFKNASRQMKRKVQEPKV